ncbi:MAG: FAD-dependent oxidoreductase [Oscillospiraceae bacterium]|jgi:phytoene dehydrogenase-like protein|nr:FAD-dependent oxidoreductase [Oscillospiraceae bacterium]
MSGQKRIAIIGGGVAGLSAGIYAQLHGFHTAIYEKNDVPGGACTGWTSDGLPVEGSLRFLAGTAEDTPLYHCWDEVGALRDTLFVNPDSFYTVEDSGETIEFCQDIDRFCSHAEKISPEDGTLLHRFRDTVLKVQGYVLPAEKPADLLGPLESRHANAVNGEAARMLARLHNVSASYFAEQFHHPALRCAFRNIMPPGSTLAQLVLCYAQFIDGSLAVPVGGSQKIIRQMVDFYLANDGELQLNAPVKEIIAANSAARGIILENGERILTHWVIAACDPEYTCRVLLQDRYSMEKKLQMRFSAPEKYRTCSVVRLFFSAPVDSVPLARTLSFPTDVIPAAGEGIGRLRVVQYGDDPLFVHNGRTELTADVPMPGRRAFQYWDKLFAHREAYEAEIDRLEGAVQLALEKRFPEMKGSLQYLGCHTPVTYAQRLNSYHGSCTAFLPTSHAPRSAMLTGRLPGLEKLLLTGQWLGEIAGMHTALIQGKFTVERICHDERLLW